MREVIALAIDPGTHKCGIAVVQNGSPPQTLFRAVVPTAQFATRFASVSARYVLHVVLIGNATYAKEIESIVRSTVATSCPIHLVPEAFTTERARARWCRENPPRHLWERLLPGFRTPSEPVDDYAAVILAEQFLANGTNLTET